MMRNYKLWLCQVLFLLSIPAIIHAASPYASISGAGGYHVTDQTIDVWGDGDNDGKPDIVETRHNLNVDVVQGPDQDWSGTAQIRPGLIHYDNFLGPRDQCTSGWGGAASGGVLILGFEQDFQDGDKVLAYTDYQGGEQPMKKGVDFIVEGFGFSFNKAFSDERGTVNIYVADASFNPVVSAADPVTGLRTVTGDETRWVKISGWPGRQADGTWKGNPDHNYGSGPGKNGLYLWGDLKGSGLSSARYIKFELGDGGHYQDPFTGKQNHGRALFVDSVKTLYHSPVAVAGNDRQVGMGVPVALDGSDSHDLDNDALTFLWTQTAGPSVTLSDPDKKQVSFAPEAPGQYEFSLTVDDGGFQGEDKITITVVGEGINQSPDARAGEDLFCNAGDRVALDGSASFDPDNDSLQYVWEQVSGTPVTLDNPGSERAGFTAPNIPVSLVFKLSVTDGQGLSDSDMVEVFINRPPMVDISKTKDAATESLLFTLDASQSWDPDLDKLAYEWVQVSGPPVRISDPAKSCPTFIVPEAPNKTMLFEVTVSDGRGFFIKKQKEVIIRKLYVIKEDNPATSTWQVGSFSFRENRLDKGKAALEFPDFTTEGKGDASGFPNGNDGSLTIRFDIPVADGDGADLSIHHFGTGDTQVFASIDKARWVSLGKLDPVRGTGPAKQDFDFAQFPELSRSRVISVQYIKIVKSNIFGDRYIDGLVGHYTALTGIWASYARQASGMVDWVDKKSDAGANALGRPDYDPSVPGVGNCSGWMVNSGALTVGFDNPFTDRGGPDLYIHHFGQGVTDKDITLGNTAGATTVEVSKDGKNWIFLGDLPLGKNQGRHLSEDGFDFKDYPELGPFDASGQYRDARIRYVRINKNGTGYTSGKFFDSVEGRFGFPGTGDPAGADVTVTEGAGVVLGRKNPAGDDYRENTYIWKQIDNGGPRVVLSAEDAKNPTFVAPMVDGEPVPLVFELTRINEDRFGVSRSRINVLVVENSIQGFAGDVTTFFNSVAVNEMGISCPQGDLVFYEAADPDYKFSEGRITDMKNRPKNLDYGMLNFSVKTAPMATAVVEIHLPKPAPEGYKWFKYSKKTGWIEFMQGSASGSATDGAQFSQDRKTVSIHITDNGPFDDDDTEGMVKDPSGLGLPGGWHDSGGSGGGGCFINCLFK